MLARLPPATDTRVCNMRALQCQAQLRALAEHRSRARELLLREKEHEARLTASRLESARAEAVADNKAAEVERLRGQQVGVCVSGWRYLCVFIERGERRLVFFWCGGAFRLPRKLQT